MKTFIVLTTNRKVAEFIEATEFEIFDKNIKDDLLYIGKLFNNVKTMLNRYDLNNPDDVLLIYPISDFMDEINSEEIDMSNYFMSYIFVK